MFVFHTTWLLLSVDSWATGRLLSVTWSMEQLDRCGLPSWPERALYPSTAPTPAGTKIFSLFLTSFSHHPFCILKKPSFCVFSGPWSLFTSVMERCRVSLFIDMLHPRPCSPMGQIMLPMKASAPVDSPVCWTSAAADTVSQHGHICIYLYRHLLCFYTLWHLRSRKEDSALCEKHSLTNEYCEDEVNIGFRGLTPPRGNSLPLVILIRARQQERSGFDSRGWGMNWLPPTWTHTDFAMPLRVRLVELLVVTAWLWPIK